MKNFYEVLLFISIMCMAGDSESMLVFVIWHIVWLAVMAFCWWRLGVLEGKEE